MLHAVLREAEDDDAAAQARALKAVATVCRGLEEEHGTTAEEAGLRPCGLRVAI